MFKEIHDSLLVGYSVSSKDEKLVLYIEPHHGSASAALKGFYIDSSYGLSGWVFAQSAKLESSA